MKPMFLASVEQGEPGGVYADSIRALEAGGMPVPQIMRLFAYKPDRTLHLAHYTQGAMRGPSPLSPGLRELIAAYTSRLNHCPFWVLSHAAVAAELLGDRVRVDAVLENPETAPIPAVEKALFAFVQQVNGASYRLEQAHVDAVIAAGWSEEAVYDAITVCALFNFYNRWCDAAGVHPMTAEQHAMSGKRMAQRGYVPPKS